MCMAWAAKLMQSIKVSSSGPCEGPFSGPLGSYMQRAYVH